MKNETIYLCEGVGKDGVTMCPIKDKCAFYCVGFDKSKTDHYAFAPYNFRLGKCDIFQEIDLDYNELNIISNV